MPKREQIDVEELKKVFRIRNGNLERLNYHYPNGKWTVVENKKNTSSGYCTVSFNGKMVMYHIIIWILSTCEDIPKGMEIDHINGDKLDNKIENLRIVSHRVNSQNQKVHRNGQLTGCSFSKRDSRYSPRILISGKLINLGFRKTEQEANEAYKIACKYIAKYTDNDSFRELIKKEMEK